MVITAFGLPAHSSGCLVNDLRYLISQQPLMFLHGIPLSFSFKFSNFSQKKALPFGEAWLMAIVDQNIARTALEVFLTTDPGHNYGNHQPA